MTDSSLQQWLTNLASNLGVQGTFHGSVTNISHVGVQPASLAPSLQPRLQLPAPVEDFTGRQAELKQLTAVVQNQAPPCRTIGIFGMPGVGKTALAVMLANQLTAHFPDAQIVLSLMGTEHKPLPPIAALQEVVRGFYPDAKLPDTLSAMKGYYQSVLREKRILILADDAASASQVQPLLPPEGSLLLITGRTTFPLEGMHWIALQPLPASDARHLLQTIAHTPIAPSTLESLTAACARLPLAIRVVANQLQVDPTLTPARLNDRLRERRLHYLSDPDHPREPLASVQASIALSYDLLPPPTQQLLKAVSILPTSFDYQMAQALAATDLEMTESSLRQLVQANLATYDGEAERFTIFELVRDVAATFVSEPELAMLQDRLAQHIAVILREVEQQYEQGGTYAWAALRCFDRERPAIGLAWRTLRAAMPNDRSDELLLQYAFLTRNIGELRYHPLWDRIPQYEAMRDAARRQHRPRDEAIALTNLGRAYMALGQYDTARAYYTANLALVQQLGKRRSEGLVLGHLGEVFAALGDYPRAIAYHRENLRIIREVSQPYRRAEMIALSNLGYALACNGQIEEALPLHHEQLEYAVRGGDVQQTAIALSRLGFAHYASGRLDWARWYLGTAWQLAEALGDLRLQSYISEWLGLTFARQHHVGLAIRWLKRARTLATQMHDQAGSAQIAWQLGEACYRVGDTSAALELAEEYLAFVKTAQKAVPYAPAVGDVSPLYPMS